MLKREDVIPFLKEYCRQNDIDFDVAYDQIKLATLDYVGLFVSDPNAPEPNGLANDRETMMLPTLYIHRKNGQFYAEETPYTDKFLKKRHMVMNEMERESLRIRLHNPDKSVKCPRCGGEIIFEERGNSTAVFCENNCIQGGIRGI